MTLEEQLREAAERGITHLSVYPTHSADRRTIYWHAQASPSTPAQISKASAMDIVEAVAQALHDMSRAPKRTIGKHPALAAPYGKENQGTLPIDAIPGKETEDGSVTAAVKPSTMEDFLPKA